MTTEYKLEDLDLSTAIEIIPSQDPQTSLRFNLPIPNWLDENNAPKFENSNFKFHDDDDKPDHANWRFHFFNPKDHCEQDVRINGSAVITFMGLTPEKCTQFLSLINEYATHPDDITPEDLEDILQRSQEELELDDMYDNLRVSVNSYMHPYTNIQSPHKDMGAFLPKPSISTAVYLSNSGIFLDGPTTTPQKFEDGAFIVFPGKSKKVVQSTSADEIRNSKDYTAKLIQADVIIKSRTLTDNSEIDLNKIQPKTPKNKKTFKMTDFT